MIGDNIKRVRLSRGYTQQELEELSGVDQRQISAYEGSKTIPTLSVAKKLAVALGVSMNELTKED